MWLSLLRKSLWLPPPPPRGMVFSKFIGKTESEMQVFFSARAVVAPLHLVCTSVQEAGTEHQGSASLGAGARGRVGASPMAVQGLHSDTRSSLGGELVRLLRAAQAHSCLSTGPALLVCQTTWDGALITLGFASGE